MQILGWMDDQIFAAEEAFADFDFAVGGFQAGGDGAADGFVVFDDEDGVIAHGCLRGMRMRSV